MKTALRRLLIVLIVAYACAPSIGDAYTWNGRRWRTSPVAYYVNPTNNDVDQAAAIAAVQTAASNWSTQTNASFSFYYAGQTTGNTFAANGKNEVFFRGSNGGYRAETMRWIDGAGYIIDADIAFYDDSVRYFTGTTGCSAGAYIEDTGTHEFGHALGLSHSTIYSATMYPSAPDCEQYVRSLDPDDIAGVEAIYPPSTATPVNTPPTVSIGSPSNGSAFSEGTSITFSGSASDQEEGNISSRLVWTSSINGQIGTGSSVTTLLSAGNHTITAEATDINGVTSSGWVSISVSAPTSTPPPTSLGIVLSANGFRVKGRSNVDLSWGGTASASVDVYRNGVRVTATANDGSYTDALGKRGGGTYAYQICETGSTLVCSNTATVVF